MENDNQQPIILLFDNAGHYNLVEPSTEGVRLDLLRQRVDHKSDQVAYQEVVVIRSLADIRMGFESRYRLFTWTTSNS